MIGLAMVCSIYAESRAFRTSRGGAASCHPSSAVNRATACPPGVAAAAAVLACAAGFLPPGRLPRGSASRLALGNALRVAGGAAMIGGEQCMVGDAAVSEGRPPEEAHSTAWRSGRQLGGTPRRLMQFVAIGVVATHCQGRVRCEKASCWKQRKSGPDKATGRLFWRHPTGREKWQRRVHCDP